MYVLKLIFPYFLKTLLAKVKLVRADANLSPFLGGRILILELNNFATSSMLYSSLLEML